MQVTSIVASSADVLNQEQKDALDAMCNASKITANAYWLVDGNIPAVEATGMKASNEPTHWWKNNQWTPVTFIALTEVA